MILLILALSSPLSALTLDQIEIKKISRAKSAVEIEQIRSDSEKIRIARLACKIQMRSRVIPESCYQALALEEKFGLRQNRDLITRLDQKCVGAAQRLHKILVSNLKNLSPTCRSSVVRAQELMAYKLE